MFIINNPKEKISEIALMKRKEGMLLEAQLLSH
jgi:hypothetical protein